MSVIALAGPAWWRFEGLPTADEWQAWWGFATFLLAVAAAWIALHQVREMRGANVAASNANRLAAEAAIQAMRPYVVVRFEFDALVPKNPRGATESGFALVIIENIGKSPAMDLTLRSNPVFQSSGDGTPDEDPDRGLRWIREKFSGSYVFKYIPPGRKFEYVLDTTRGLMDSENGLPQVYEVEARYTGPRAENGMFVETHVLDAEPWHLSAIRADPSNVIAQQFRRANETSDKRDRSATKFQSELIGKLEKLATRPTDISRNATDQSSTESNSD